MPSFDITSEADLVALKNAVDVAGRHIGNRYDFKGTSARAELNEKDKTITINGDSEFQLGQVKDILFPEMEKKERESTKRLEHGPVQSVGGNKSKQELKIKVGIEMELAKKIVKLIKDSKLKVQASISGDFVRVASKDRDTLQSAIKLLRDTDFGIDLQFTNYRTN